MSNILTADEFVALVLASMRLLHEKPVLSDSSLDAKFERAYETLSGKEKEMGIETNFTFYTDPFHGNSTKLRDALVNARERGLLKPAPERPNDHLVAMSAERARALLDRGSLKDHFLQQLVQRTFRDILDASPGPAV